MNAPVESSNEYKGIALDFVFVGRVIDEKGKQWGKIQKVVNGKLEAIEAYGMASLRGKAIGVVYAGATFHEGGCRGLKNAQFSHRWADAGQVMDWKIRDDATETELRTAKLEADAKRVNEIESIMLPLRKRYEAYSSKRDHAGKEALEAAVLRALRCAPRATEI